MAIGVGSVVAVKVSSAQLSLGNASAQPPCFGNNESASTPFTITWSNNGNRVAGIPGTGLDEITDAGDPAQALLGKVVNTAESSPANNSLVVGAYARSGVDVLLLRNLQAGSYLEILATDAVLQAGL
jgi:hypothetical protein